MVLNRSTVVISFRFASPALVLLCLKGKCRFDEIFIVGCTGSCHLAPSSASSDGNVMPQCKWHYPHDDVIKWKHFPRNWPFVREIHRSPVNFPHKGQWRGALMFSLIYAWMNDWVNNHEASDLKRQHGHYDVIVMPEEYGWTHDMIPRRLVIWLIY